MQTNKQALEEALEFFPGGVNSPARAFKAVGGGPVFMAQVSVHAFVISKGETILIMSAHGGR